MMWLIPKSQYDVANSKSPTTMSLIPNILLRCGKFKARYDATLFTKTVMMRHYLQSPLLHDNTLQNLKIIFYKAQILIWHLFSQSPNSYLALFHKAQIPIWHYFSKPKFSFGIYFYKAQILIWHLFSQSPNSYLASIFTKPK